MLVNDCIYVMSGRDQTLARSTYLIGMLNLSAAIPTESRTWSWSPWPNALRKHVYGKTVLLDNRFVVSVGGTLNNLYIDKITYFDTLQDKNHDVWSTLQSTWDIPTVDFGPKGRIYFAMVPYHDGLLVIGGRSNDGQTATILQTGDRGDIVRFSANSTAAPLLGCGEGSFRNSSTNKCEFCPRGSFARRLGSNYSEPCVPCPEGYYGPSVGALSALACLPCADGTYNAERGAVECLPCGTHDRCPLGSVTQNVSNLIDASSVSEQIPLVEVNQRTEDILDAQMFLGMAFAIVVCLCTTYLYFNGRRRNYSPETRFPDLDFLVQKDYTREEPTRIGVIFSMLACLSMVTWALYVGLPVYFNNTVKSESLIPRILVAQQIASEYEFMVTLVNFQGTCVKPGSLDQCAEGISVDFASLNVDVTATVALSCGSPGPNLCMAVWTCSRCSVLPGGVDVLVSFDGSGSFADSLLWQLSASSGVPEQPSVTGGEVFPNSVAYRFRGLVPTVVQISLLESIFTDNINELQDVGYLGVFIDKTLGSEVNNANFHDVNGVRFGFHLDLSVDFALAIILNQKQSVFVLASAIAGANTITNTYYLF